MMGISFPCAGASSLTNTRDIFSNWAATLTCDFFLHSTQDRVLFARWAMSGPALKPQLLAGFLGALLMLLSSVGVRQDVDAKMGCDV